MRGGGWGKIEFPALVGLISHPARGWVLYDTGYSDHFTAATRRFPECLYQTLSPPVVPPGERLLAQLEARNISVGEIGTIIISHFHADHVAGLKDFPGARFIATKDEYREMSGKGRFARVRKGFLAELLPADFAQRAGYAEDCPQLRPELPGFETGYDLFGDGSLTGVPLPGHTRSQLGLLFSDRALGRTFLVGDACWKIEGLEQDSLPSALASWFFASKVKYRQTFSRLVALRRSEASPVIIPSHCSTSWRKYGGAGHA